MSYKIELPTSDQSRLAHLQLSAAQGARDNAQGQAYLSPALVTELETFIPRYETAFNNIASFKGAQSNQVETANDAVNELIHYIRDMWAVVRRRVRRSQASPAILRYYQLPMHGQAPQPTSREEWLNLAAAIIEGDADAATAGYPPAANPSATELQTVLDAAETALADLAAAKQALHNARLELAGLRREADQLIRTVTSELRHTLREMTAAQRRAMMRRYGVRFQAIGGTDQPEEEETADEVMLAAETAVSGSETTNSNGNGYHPADMEALLVPANGASY